ncbi:MAG TPA: hypothetical protein VEJ89_03035 [Myxococcaceae bacterium]|nr:hypothetical protein [Myxococcaceae bacterium]
MNVVAIYLRIYADCLRRALTSIAKSPWTLLLPMGLLLALQLAGMAAAPLGIAAGFVMGLVLAALGSCYLYFLGELAGSARVRVTEFGQSVKAYFWSVINVLFVYWVASLVIGLLPQAHAFKFALSLVALVLLNAVPEVIYQGKTYGGLETMGRAVRFLQSNWLEWGVPNALLLAALWLVLGEAAVSLGVLGLPGVLVLSALVGGLFHLVMVFRGHLFAALDGTSHRQRMFRYRTTA